MPFSFLAWCMERTIVVPSMSLIVDRINYEPRLDGIIRMLIWTLNAN